MFEQITDYDGKGRAWKTTTTLSGPITYSSSVTFDAATGRVVTQQYPTGFTVKYDYRPGTGFLNKVSNNAPRVRLVVASIEPRTRGRR